MILMILSIGNYGGTLIMTIKDAIPQRHMVRKYLSKPILAETVTLLNTRIADHNARYGLNLKLVTGNSDGIGGMAKLLLTKSVYNYIVLAGQDCVDLDEKLYNSTERIIGKKHQLKWCTYQQLENNRYPTADVVIFHFTKEIIERERAFAAIIKIKGSLGHLTPILAISEGGSIQDIFSILKAGAYDYIETIDNTRKYKKKIENLILWNWYIKKHTSAKKRQC